MNNIRLYEVFYMANYEPAEYIVNRTGSIVYYDGDEEMPTVKRLSELLSLTEPAYTAEDAGKQVEMRLKHDRNFIKICQVKPHRQIFRKLTYEECQKIKNKWFSEHVELIND
jgi:hypothetical protein